MIIPHRRAEQPEILDFKNFFDVSCLEYINHLMSTEQWEYAWVGDVKQSKQNLIRSTKNIVVEYNNDSNYLYQEITKSFLKANEIFKYSLTSVQDIFILRYKVGDFYKSHLDIGGNVSDRKISLIVQLTDENDYTGCDTNLYRSATPLTISKKFNTGTLFPSYVLHEATPLLTGTRYALVAWATGEPFR